MKRTTSEWVRKAEDDFYVAQTSYRARKRPTYDAAVFHCQQCVEKYMKARLEEAGLSIARTHDLLTLYQEVLNVEPGWVVLQPFFAFLTPFAVAYRYPGFSASKSDAKDALTYCRAVRRIVRGSLGLSV